MTIYSGSNYRKVYESYYGPIPKDKDGRSYEIHHIDGNHSNINISNLKCVTIQEHYDIHLAQGDWAACVIMGARMKISSEEISRLSSLGQQKRVADGIHSFQKRADGTSVSSNKVAKGKHHLQKRADGTSLASDRVRDGTNPFLGGEIQRKSCMRQLAKGTHPFLNSKKQQEKALKRVINGTHPFLGGEIQRKSNQKRVSTGTHNFLNPESWKCEYCDREGKGASNYTRWHGNRCKDKAS